MIKEKYNQLLLCSQFGGIRAMKIHNRWQQAKENITDKTTLKYNETNKF